MITNETKPKQFIGALENYGFYAECPACEETVKQKECGLFYLNSFPDSAREVFDGLKRGQRDRADGLSDEGKTVVGSRYYARRSRKSSPTRRGKRT